MDEPVLITADDLRRRLSIAEAIGALRTALAASRVPAAPQRLVLSVGEVQFLVMPTAGTQSVGAKLVTINPGNVSHDLPLIQGVFVLFGGRGMGPRAVIDGAALTELRTAAVSGLATDLLARQDARRLVIFGAGVQARAHLEAMQAVRQIEAVVIVSRTAARAEAFRRVAEGKDVRAQLGSPEAVTDADIVCTCTTSARPVFKGEDLAPGVHINAVGSYQAKTREIDDTAVRRADVVAVETQEAALSEAGDLIGPMEEGTLDTAAIAELRDVVQGGVRRSGANQITLFKSVGVAFEDLVVADAAMKGSPGSDE